MTVTIAGQKMTVAGGQKLAGGRAQSLDVSVPVSGIGTIRMRYVDDILYTKLPPSLSSTPASWVIASSTSSNPALQQIAGSLPAMKNAASLESFTQYAAAASTFKTVGTKRIGGKKTTHYSLMVDVSKVQGPAGVELTEAGQKTLPVEIWSDDTGRVVQAKQARVVKGEAEPSEVTLSAYNVPVTITAPPASQLVAG
jgi:hypothetical protein